MARGTDLAKWRQLSCRQRFQWKGLSFPSADARRVRVNSGGEVEATGWQYWSKVWHKTASFLSPLPMQPLCKYYHPSPGCLESSYPEKLQEKFSYLHISWTLCGLPCGSPMESLGGTFPQRKSGDGIPQRNRNKNGCWADKWMGIHHWGWLFKKEKEKAIKVLGRMLQAEEMTLTKVLGWERDY